jgi:hypothetical protein
MLTNNALCASILLPGRDAHVAHTLPARFTPAFCRTISIHLSFDSSFSHHHHYHGAIGMRMHRSLYLAALVALALVTHVSLFSQTRKVTTTELAQQSEVVARGSVRQLKSAWEGKKERIVTYVTIQVDEFIKGGGAEKTLTLVNPGGEVDGVGEMYTHMATFREGEDVIVFAQKDREGRLRVAGGQQGKFRLEKDKVTGKTIVGGATTVEDFSTAVRQAGSHPEN